MRTKEETNPPRQKQLQFEEILVEEGRGFTDLARVLSQPHTLRILERLNAGPKRFSELERDLGRTILDRRLKALLAVGLVKRQEIIIRRRKYPAYALDEGGFHLFDFKKRWEDYVRRRSVHK